MSDYEGMEQTNDTTIAGEAIYREYGTNDEYYENSYGELVEYSKGQHMGDSGSKNYGASLAPIKFILLAVGGIFSLWLSNHMHYCVFNTVFKYLPIVLFILPIAVKKLRSRLKLINYLLAGSVFIYFFPRIDTLLGSGANSNFSIESFLFYGLNAFVTFIISGVILTAVRFVQKKIFIALK